jgi:hypothetical protein
MSDLFSEGFEPQSMQDWRRAIESGLSHGETYDSLIWRPERRLTVEPALTARPEGHLSEPIFDTAGKPVICDNLRHLLANDIPEALQLAHQMGASGVELSADQFLGLDFVTATASGFGLTMFVRCESIHEWKAVLAAWQRPGFEQMAGSVHLLFDPFPLAASPQRRAAPSSPIDESRTGLDNLVESSVAFRKVCAGTLWAVDTGSPVLRTAGSVTRTTYVLCALSSLYQSLTRSGADLSGADALARVVWPIGDLVIVEVAAIRALRIMVPQMLKSITKGTLSPASVPFYATNRIATGAASEAKIDFPGRLVAATIQAAVGLITGCESVTLNLDETANEHSERDARRWLRNILLILEHEGRVVTTADPIAGSYSIEALTDQIALKSWASFLEIEAAGGIETDSGWRVLEAECDADAAWLLSEHHDHSLRGGR